MENTNFKKKIIIIITINSQRELAGISFGWQKWGILIGKAECGVSSPGRGGGLPYGGVIKGKQQNLKSFSSDFGHLLVRKRTEFEVNWESSKNLQEIEGWDLEGPRSPPTTPKAKKKKKF